MSEDNTNNVETEKKKYVKKPKTSIQKFDDLEGKFLLVKVGTSEEPASDYQIKLIQERLEDFFETNRVNCLVFVTHHAISMEIIEKPSNMEG